MKKEIFKHEITILKEIRVGLILGTIYGLMLGFFANFKFLDSDPAIVTGPFVTISISILGILIYCTIANTLFNL